MQLLDVTGAGRNYTHTWPDRSTERYAAWIDYRGLAPDGEHTIRVCFGERPVYGQNDRKRVLILIDDRVYVEFIGADDFDCSGDLLSEIKIRDRQGEHMCRYPDDAVPERYAGLPVTGLPTRVCGDGVHNAWAVLANVADHRMLVALAALRRQERQG
jgi:hypothetical protein